MVCFPRPVLMNVMGNSKISETFCRSVCSPSLMKPKRSRLSLVRSSKSAQSPTLLISSGELTLLEQWFFYQWVCRYICWRHKGQLYSCCRLRCQQHPPTLFLLAHQAHPDTALSTDLCVERLPPPSSIACWHCRSYVSQERENREGS